MNIYEIDKEMQFILDNIEIDEETGEVLLNEDALNELQMERDRKVENLLLYLKNAKAILEAIKGEINSLKDRYNSLTKKIERTEDYASRVLDGKGFETAKVKAGFRKSTSVDLQEDFYNEDYMIEKTEYKPDKKAIKEDLLKGVSINGASLINKVNLYIK